MRLPRLPAHSFEPVVAACALYVGVVLNWPLWRRLQAIVDPNNLYEWLFLAALGVELTCILYFLFGLFAWRWLFKPVATLLILAAAAGAYFIGEFGIIIDPAMIRNVFETERFEAADFITPGYLGSLALFGALPCLLIWLLRFEVRPWRAELRRRALIAAAMLAVMVAVALPFVQNLTSVLNENRYLRHLVNPLNTLNSLYAHVRQGVVSAGAPVLPFGEDARRAPTRQGRTLAVIVVGETARAANFSLGGYARPTNPRLAGLTDLVYFTRAYACGTSTAESVPCIFSGHGRAEFSIGAAARRENLLDIFKRTGFTVFWRDNQTGCKGVCARVDFESLVPASKTLLDPSTAHDDVLLRGLPEWIAGLDRDGVLVLHMIGSHGPAYFKRYPPEFERFRPACRNAQFSRCGKDEIVNAYDNSLLYTDHILVELQTILRAAEARGVASVMLYASDHGESLGENNIYLHGLPYVLAPETQKHIPFLLWASPNFRAASRLDLACLRARREREISHDNIFHTMLGLLRIDTKVYRPGLDITAECRKVVD